MNIGAVVFVVAMVVLFSYLMMTRGSKTEVLPMPRDPKDRGSSTGDGGGDGEGGEDIKTMGWVPQLIGKFTSRRSL